MAVMPKDGTCLFKICYFVYTRTRLGYYFHLNDIKKSKEKLGVGRHSELTQFDYGDLRILPIPMVLDNYAYLVSDQKSKKSVVIDPGHAQAVQQVLEERNIEPDAILVTHKHWDHSGGNRDLKQIFPNVSIYGSILDNVPDCTHYVTDGDVLTFGELKFQAILTAGHTVGHTAFLLDFGGENTQKHLFSGDCLFLGGCGRMFEASPSVMLSSLDTLRNLEEETLVWPGHEYAKDNLEFAQTIDPTNLELQRKCEWVQGRRSHLLCTCPSTIGEEKLYNPFLRTENLDLLRSLGMNCGDETDCVSDVDRAKALALIRECKDAFKYKL